jgi:hypothetical protein
MTIRTSKAPNSFRLNKNGWKSASTFKLKMVSKTDGKEKLLVK